MTNTQKPDFPESDPWAHEKGIGTAKQTQLPQGDTVSDEEENLTETSAPPQNLFEFVRQFYVTKAVIGEKYKEHFRDLHEGLTAEQQEELFRLAEENDREYSKTLSLAEFVLETPGKQNLRDHIMHFIQRVASNAGHLAAVESNAVFQLWLDGNSALSDKLNFFFSQIEQITEGKDKQGKAKKLAQKPRNNLGCIAAMWLYYKEQTDLTQLIAHLMKSGMNLQGEAGPMVESRAFAFVASMIKSTNKKKFAYFVDYVGRNETRLIGQFRDEMRKNSELSRKLASLNEDLRNSYAGAAELQQELGQLQQQYNELHEKKSVLEKEIKHASIHHGADLQSADSQFNTVLNGLLDTLHLAKTAFSRGPEKAHILEYQLDEMEQLIQKELK